MGSIIQLLILAWLVLKGPRQHARARPTKGIRIPDGVIVLLSQNFFFLLLSSEMEGKSNSSGSMAGAKNMYGAMIFWSEKFFGRVNALRRVFSLQLFKKFQVQIDSARYLSPHAQWE